MWTDEEVTTRPEDFHAWTARMRVHEYFMRFCGYPAQPSEQGRTRLQQKTALPCSRVRMGQDTFECESTTKYYEKQGDPCDGLEPPLVNSRRPTGVSAAVLTLVLNHTTFKLPQLHPNKAA